MASFSDQVGGFVDDTERKFTMAVRKIAIDAFSEVILKTPVDTGRARGNWLVSIGDASAGTVELNDKTGQVTIGEVQAEALGLELGDVIYLSNNLPYIEALEDGWSGQAPSGFVKLTVQRFQIIANQAFAAIGRG